MPKSVNKRKFDTQMLVIVSMLIALNIVFSRFLSIKTHTWKLFDFSILTLALAGILFGANIGALVGALGDIFGMLIFSRGMPYFPLFTVSQALLGYSYGLFFYKKRSSWKNIGFGVGFNAIFINFLFMYASMILYLRVYVGSTKGLEVILLDRLITVGGTLAIELICIKPIWDFAVPQIQKIIKRQQTKAFVEYNSEQQNDINLGLSRIEKLLQLLKNPQEKLKAVHITGTNGKGSVCAYVANTCIKSGYKTGKLTSPKLKMVNECITVDNVEITDRELNNIFFKIKELSDKMFSETGERPSRYEVWVAAAFVHFVKKGCDIVILETGLGGKLDATNIIKHPLISVITRIDIDHKQFLGDTISKIAVQKAGIIKQDCLSATINQPKEAMDVILEKAKEMNSNCIIASNAKVNATDYINENISYGGIDNIRLGISGYYQAENASLSIEVLKALRDKCRFEKLTDKNIKDGLESVKTIGRFELINKSPCIIFDGAHNVNGIMALKSSIDRYFEKQKITYVIGFMRDKEISDCLNALKPKNCYFVTVKDNERAATAEELVEIAKPLNIKAKATDLNTAYKTALEGDGITVFCGSLYMYKELSELM